MFFLFCIFEPNKFIIMPLAYTYTSSRDVHTFRNDEATSVNYEIVKVDCDANTTISQGTLLPGETKVLNFVLDALYNIELSTLIETTVIYDILITKNLRDSIVTLAEKVLCGCKKCDDCEECTDCEDYLEMLVESIGLDQITYPKYHTLIQDILSYNNCLLKDALLTCLKNQKVYGNAEIKPVLLQMVSSYYLAFYFIDFNEAQEGDKDYITEVYKYNKISKCVRKLGVLYND